MEMYSIDERKEDLAASITFLQELKDKRDIEPDRNSKTFRNYSVAITGLEKSIAFAQRRIAQLETDRSI